MKRPNLLQRMKGAIRNFGFKQWFLLILNIALVLGSVACVLGLGYVGGALTALHAADWFRGESETRFAQLACYLPVDQGKTEEDMYTFRQSLDSKLVEQALEAPEGGRLYIDAYSGSASVTVASDNSGNASVKATGVGGDFFYFHPYILRSGSYIKSGDLMDDLVVLDEETAWKLFGGVELAGMTMTINGQPFVVSGVIAREDDFASRKAYTGDGGVFMSFAALQRLIEGASITSYEIVMPDPITNYAKGILEDAFPIGDGDIVENSSRYSLVHLWEVIRAFGQRSMRTNGVIYPYWENAARLTEDYAALLLVLAVLLALYPALSLLVLVIREIIRTYRFAKVKIPEKVEAVVEKRKEDRLERQYEKKNG
ncbi:MAG: ABC transporter permease, partial [Oscillospiraceae bacterium]|nr:ABC transporter permease [Oscillospiraceae bacterium]